LLLQNTGFPHLKSFTNKGKAFRRNKPHLYQAKHMQTPIIILVTTASKAEAEKIAQVLLQERLVACVNIVGPVSSHFIWEGKIDCAEEFLMVMKSQKELFDRVVERVKGLHSYEVAEVLALPVVGGAAEYLGWLGSVLN
jgi:periplasmic divalent cation tolerance protein